MNKQDAIKSMNNLDELISITESEHESVRMAISALEKQISKKPIEARERHNFRGDVIYKDGYCPICKNEMNSASIYCNRCGQAIDWGNEDE